MVSPLRPVRATVFTIKLVMYLAFAALFVTSAYVAVQLRELKLLSEFKALQQEDPLPEARRLEAAGEYCKAIEYLDYFMDYKYVRENPEAQALYSRIKAEREDPRQIGLDILSGVWRGKGACTESLVSATVSDFLVVGDVRDLLWGVVDTYRGKDADTFTMALAGFGVLLTGATVISAPASGGTSVPAGVSAKASVSLLKITKKFGKLPASLQKALVGVFKKCARTRSLRPFRPMAEAVYGLSRVKGLKLSDFMTVISRSRNLTDLKMMERAARIYGKNTGKFIALTGDLPVDMLKRYGNSRDLTKAINTSIQYGPEGRRLLKKTGPTRFLKYMNRAKYTARAGRSVWKNRLPLLLAHLMKFLPESALLALLLGSGVVTLGVPVRRVAKAMRRSRKRVA